VRNVVRRGTEVEHLLHRPGDIESRERAAVVVLGELIADSLDTRHRIANDCGNLSETGHFGGSDATEAGDELEAPVLPSFHEHGGENSVPSDRLGQRLDITELLAHVATPTNVAERNDGHLGGGGWRRDCRGHF
jgi:hypothetical protein